MFNLFFCHTLRNAVYAHTLSNTHTQTHTYQHRHQGSTLVNDGPQMMLLMFSDFCVVSTGHYKGGAGAGARGYTCLRWSAGERRRQRSQRGKSVIFPSHTQTDEHLPFIILHFSLSISLSYLPPFSTNLACSARPVSLGTQVAIHSESILRRGIRKVF